MYRPLPDGLTIKNSPIEGLGLFTNIAIKKGISNPKNSIKFLSISSKKIN